MFEIRTTSPRDAHLLAAWAAIVALPLFAGCAAAPASDAATYEGTWNVKGTATASCPSETPQAAPIAGQLTILGQGSGLVMTDVGGCNLRFAVTPTDATIDPGQTCTSTENGSTATVAYQSDVLSPTSDDNTLTEAISGTLSVTTGTQTTPCTYTASLTLTRQ